MQSCYEDLIILDVDAKDSEDVIRQVGQLLYKGGFVKDTYIDAVAAREKEFPTGLILQDIQIAMPHTAGVHVNTPAVCIAKLAHPVEFGHMGDPDTKVMAELIFMMAIKNPEAQIETLQKVMGVFTNAEAVQALKDAEDKETLFKVAQHYIG
ncbi:MAG: PTS sugar transporter subunit IIA [Clostridiales bacterium]|nr:PTS sugar transporter subunit IIA [Clostridiales bacterium]